MRIHQGETIVENQEARREGDFMEPKALVAESNKAVGFQGKQQEPVFLPKSQVHLVRAKGRLFLWIRSWLYEKNEEIADIVTR